MSRDSQVSYLHLKSSHHVLYINNWVPDKVPFDDVEVPAINIEDDEDISSFQNTAFGSVKSLKKNRDIVWKDLELKKLLESDASYLKEIHDDTLLKKLDAIHYVLQPEASSPDTTMSTNTVRTVPSIEISTPDVSRRSSRRNYQSYQTPVGRIMR